MNWIQDNKALATLLAIVLVAGGGLGYWLFNNHSGYSAAQESFDRARNQVNQLESQPLYPDEANLQLQRESTALYRTAVEELRAGLLQYQPPRNTPTANEFQARLNQRITGFKASAAENGLKLPAAFAFDMERYTAVLPSEPTVSDVDWQLDALIHLAELMVASGVDEITQFSRVPMAAEEAGATADGEGAYRVYPIEIRFIASQDSFQQVLNSLSQPHSSSHYLLPRVVRIENESIVGPPTGTPIVPTPITPDGAPTPPPATGIPDFDFNAEPVDELPEESPEPEENPEPGEMPGESGDELELVGDPPVTDGLEDAEDGFGFLESEFFGGAAPRPSAYIDARIILGQEKLRIYLRVDLLDFTIPPAAAEEPVPGEPVAASTRVP